MKDTTASPSYPERAIARPRGQVEAAGVIIMRFGKGLEASFLASHSDAVLGLPWIAKGTFLSGAVIAEHDLEKVTGFLEGYPVSWPDEQTLLQYATL